MVAATCCSHGERGKVELKTEGNFGKIKDECDLEVELVGYDKGDLNSTPGMVVYITISKVLSMQA